MEILSDEPIIRRIMATGYGTRQAMRELSESRRLSFLDGKFIQKSAEFPKIRRNIQFSVTDFVTGSTPPSRGA